MTFTAAILIIGNEILSGRTQDANTCYLGQRLAARGIHVNEVRIVPDEEHAIIAAVRALSSQYTYVFTTGGIGPTHDDITAESVAKAFDAELEQNPEAVSLISDYYSKKGQDINEGRLRMARIPAGADLIYNPVSAAPGFTIQNVYVMAGVPRIMQAMFEGIEETLSRGAEIHSRTITGHGLLEGDIYKDLAEVQDKYPDLDIGSYPNIAGIDIVVRGIDQSEIVLASAEIEKRIIA